MYEDLERQLKESQDKNKTVKTDKNPFGAGRKRAYIEYAKQIEKLHKDGLSIRWKKYIDKISGEGEA